MDLQLRDSKPWSIWRFSFTRKRAMHINIEKVIFSIGKYVFFISD